MNQTGNGAMNMPIDDRDNRPDRPALSRRRLLLGSATALGAGLAATWAAGPVLASPIGDEVGAEAVCAGYPAINRDWIGRSSLPLHFWSHYTPAGGNGHDTSRRHSDQFNPTFHEECSRWAANYEQRLSNVGHRVSWFGTLGIANCRPPSMHAQGRGFDLTRIQYTDGVFVDMKWSYQQDILQRRRYLAVAAHLRWYFRTVITAWHNADHHNHIHFDNGQAMGPLVTTDRHTDIVIVQAAARLLISSDVAMDHVWGPATENAYQELLARFDMRCLNPKTDTSHARTFMTFIARHGFYNRAAGAFTHTC